MGMILNDRAWRALVDEDIEWLMSQPPTLERDHIRDCLLWLREHKPTAPAEPTKEVKS